MDELARQPGLPEEPGRSADCSGERDDVGGGASSLGTARDVPYLDARPAVQPTGDDYPFAASVRVHVEPGTRLVEVVLGDDRVRHDCTEDDLDRTLDTALETLVAPIRVCRSCGRTAATSDFDVFERMHYVCFHYEFEHGETDLDMECDARGCPSASLAQGRDQVIATAHALALETASGSPWTNADLHHYLEAFASWLADADGYYLNQGRVTPGNGSTVVNDALRAATVYD